MTKIEVDNDTLTHMLGYVTIENWVDALKNCSGVDQDLIRILAKVQSEAYGFDLLGKIGEAW